MKPEHPQFRTTQAAQLYIATNDLPNVEPCPIYSHGDADGEAGEILYYAIMPLRKRHKTTTEAYEQLADAGPVEVLSLRPDLLTHVYPPRRFAWGKYYPIGATAALISQGGVGKSQLTLEQQLHGAAGLPYMGMPTMPGVYVLISCEDDFRDTVERRAQRIIAAFPPEAQALSLANFKAINGVGKGLQFVICKDGMAAIAPTVDRIITAVRGYADGRTIVHCSVDTVSRVNAGQENDNNVMAAVEAAGARIAQELDCAVSLLHHTNKAVAEKSTADVHSGRGGGAFGDNCRSVLRLLPVTDVMARIERLDGLDRIELERGDVLKLVHAKLNVERRSDPIYLRRTDTGMFAKFTPTIKTDAQAADVYFDALLVWCTKRSNAPFSMKDVTETHLAEWAPRMTRSQAKTFISEAIYAEKLIDSTQRRKGGVLYVPAETTIDPFSTEETTT